MERDAIATTHQGVCYHSFTYLCPELICRLQLLKTADVALQCQICLMAIESPFT
jgi:hypothetical protein